MKPAASTDELSAQAVETEDLGAKGRFVLDADIEDYSGSIGHDKPKELVARLASDQRMPKLLRRRLEAGEMEEGEARSTYAGTPQGGVISPLLSSSYLHVLDVAWARHSPAPGGR